MDGLPEGVVRVTRMPPKCKIYRLIFSCLTQVVMDKPKFMLLEALFRDAGGREYVMKVTVALF